MNIRKLAFTATAAVTLTASILVSVSPAAAWCNRWGRCGYGYGYGYGPGAVAAGVLAGAAVGTAIGVAAARPVYVAPRVCPPGFHLGPYGHRCWAN